MKLTWYYDHIASVLPIYNEEQDKYIVKLWFSRKKFFIGKTQLHRLAVFISNGSWRELMPNGEYALCDPETCAMLDDAVFNYRISALVETGILNEDDLSTHDITFKNIAYDLSNNGAD